MSSLAASTAAAVAGSKQPAPGSQQPPACSQQPAAGLQSAAGSQQPVASSQRQQPAVFSCLFAVASHHLEALADNPLPMFPEIFFASFPLASIAQVAEEATGT